MSTAQYISAVTKIQMIEIYQKDTLPTLPRNVLIYAKIIVSAYFSGRTCHEKTRVHVCIISFSGLGDFPASLVSGCKKKVK